MNDPFEFLRGRSRPTYLDPMGNVMDQGIELSRIERARRLGTATLNIANNMTSPIFQSIGMPVNPFSFAQTAGSVFGTNAQYQNLAAQSRALLGTDQFDTTRLDRFADSLKKIGATKSDVLGVMQEMASLSRQVSANLDQAATSAISFAKATGTDAGAAARIAGSAVTASNLTLNRSTSTQLLENVRSLAGGNNVLIDPTSQAVQAFREMGLSSGRMTSFDSRSIDNAFRVQSGMSAISPLYQQRPDLAVAHFGQMQSAGSGVLLGFAMDAAARAGQSTDLVSVMSAVRRGDKDVMAGVMDAAGDNAEMLALMGFAPDFLDNLRKGGAEAFRNDRFDPKTRSADEVDEAAAGATTAVQRAQADLVNQMQTELGSIASTVNTTAKGFEQLNVKTLLVLQGFGSLSNQLGAIRGAGPASTGAEVAKEVGKGVTGSAVTGVISGSIARLGLGGAAAAVASPVGLAVVGTAAVGALGYLWYQNRQKERAAMLTGQGEDVGPDGLSSRDAARVNEVNERMRVASGGRYVPITNDVDKSQAEQDRDRARNFAAGARGSAPVGSWNPHQGGNAIDMQVIDTRTGRTTDDPAALALFRREAQAVFNRPGERVVQEGSASGIPHFHIEGLNDQLSRATAGLSSLADTATRASNNLGGSPRTSNGIR